MGTLIPVSRLDTSPPEYLVGSMLPDLGVGWGYGDSYTGKTLTLAIELCLAIANGTPYFGHETVQGAAVWGLAEGLADAGVRIKARLIREQADRLAMAAAISRREDADAGEAWLAAQPAYTDDRMFIRLGGFQIPFITQDEPTEALRRAADELSLIQDLRLLVLDTGRRYSQLSLSNGTTANRFMQGMSWLSAQLQCTILAIGHPVTKAKGETGLPGDTLFSMADFVWRVKAGQDSTDEAPNAIITAEKVKSGPLFKPIGYRLERVQWQQPPTDPETGDDIPGVPLITVQSVTARQQLDEQADTAAQLLSASQPGSPLPVAEPVPSSRPRRRTGLKPVQPFRVVTPPAAVPVPSYASPEQAYQLATGQAPAVSGRPEVSAEQDAETAARADLVARLLSEDCPREDCTAKALRPDQEPADASCAPAGTGVDYVQLDREPLVLTHLERMGAAVAHGRADMDEVLAQIGDGQARPESELAGARG